MLASVESIYEAAAVPERWPRLLDQIGRAAGARGGLIFTLTADGSRFVGSDEALAMGRDFADAGYMAMNDRVPRLFAQRHPGFQTDSDFYSETELRTHPIFAEFLIPRGWVAAAATSVRGAADDTLCLSIEGFPDHPSSRAAVPSLDMLRPHLARAALFASQLRMEKARAAVQALGVIGVPAAMLSAGAKVLAVNGRMEDLLGREVFDLRSGLRTADPAANRELSHALAVIRSGVMAGRSIALSPVGGAQPRILHLLPVAGLAHDIFLNASSLLVLTSGQVGSPLGLDLLQALFDFTPAEARIARALADGQTVQEIALASDVAAPTVRTQVRAVLAKSGQRRQTDLVRMLTSLALPNAP